MRLPESVYAFPRSMFGAHAMLARLKPPVPSDLAARVRRLEAERTARELVHAYLYAFDAKELELLLSLYDDDALLVNGFGTWRGRDAIRASHEHDLEKTAYSFHNLANVRVVLGDDDGEAWVSGYLYNVQSFAGEARGTVATGLFHLRDRAGAWKIAECRTAPAGRHALPPAPPGAEGARPTPSEPETSRDLTGA